MLSVKSKFGNHLYNDDGHYGDCKVDKNSSQVDPWRKFIRNGDLEPCPLN